MSAKKLKIHVKTSDFSFPIPAVRFGMIKWILKIIIKCYPHSMRKQGVLHSGENEMMENILNNISYQEIDSIMEHLKEIEPFELVNVETYDEKNEKVVVKICTV